MNTDLMFSSETGKWDTPASLIDDLAPLFPWDLDVCASRPNVCANFYTEEQNGLVLPWRGLCWMNPPYGRQIGVWVKRARLQARESDRTTVVCLLPARTDTRWWHDNVPKAYQVVFIKGRLRFGNAKNSAPFPSAFVVFGTHFGGFTIAQQDKLSTYGWAPV